MTATDTYLLLRAFCEELARCGMRHACTSPGSRCAPLVLSLARTPGIRSWSHVDERSAGFFALGAAKESGLPVAVTCTSGTAAANFAPAVIEARYGRVPLIVLTADRPPELKEVGAGQAIDQLKLYGDAVKWFFEVGTHAAAPQRLRWIRTLACRAYWTAAASPAGPVHLNFPLREPLVLEEPLPVDETGRPGARPFVSVEWAPAPPPPRIDAERAVLIAGAGADPGLADDCPVPVLADPLSGARRGRAAIAHYDLLLRDESFAHAHEPDLVVRFGELPTSKPLRAWLASLACEQVAVDPDMRWQDPDAVVARRLPALAVPTGAAGWLDSWRAADTAVAERVDALLRDELSEPLAARHLVRSLPAEATLFVASSMPIRDIETFAPVRDDAPRVLSNRGANGIDGTVSSAFGAAAARAGPVVLLIGDVALLHDAGGLLAARRLGLEITIVLLNNDGGGIFHFLPVAGEADAFEQHVATPHGIDFERLAVLYECGYARARAVEDLHIRPGTTIIEVSTDRQQNLALHRRVADGVASAISRSAAGAAPGA